MKARLYLTLFAVCAFLRGYAGDSVVVFNEAMYHPRDGDSLEWVELFNQMAVDVEISGWQIEGIDYTFPTNTILAGGAYLVVASNPNDLIARSRVTNVFGPFAGRLANEGERLTLRNHNHRRMDELDYKTSSPWPVGPDGSGFSLAKSHPNRGSEAAENWLVSAEPGGTPGRANFPTAPGIAPVRLNELASSTNQTFWFEVVNEGTNAVALSDFQVEFSRAAGFRFQLTNEPPLAPGAHRALRPDYHPRNNEKLFLFSNSGAELADAAEITLRLQGRSPALPGIWAFPSSETPGAPNAFAFETNVVIDEIMYSQPEGITNQTWLELFNRGSNTVDLSNWKIAGAGYSFPTSILLAPGEFLVIAQDADALRSTLPGVRILGDFSGRLSRSSDRLVLQDAFGNPADEVRYFDSEPWPSFADSPGTSLELRDARADNSRPEAWSANRTPGAWQSYTYTATATADGGPTRWNEFIFGLLDAGEVLLDDFSVLEAGKEILQNGSFENSAASWRFLGTHRNATVIIDPDDSANHVLRLAADGPTEHMHNHVETTLLNNAPIKNGTAYTISFRAKWLAGCNRLNTRLYFNRVARTTVLQRPGIAGTPGRANSSATTNTGPTFARLQHTPVVPKTSESVQVSVIATDPDGVKRCTLRWGVNGGNWNAVEMRESGGTYSASIPARTTATIVQFYVEAEDQRGAIAFYPAEGPASRAIYKVNDGQSLSSRLHNVRLIMLPAEADALHSATNVMSNGRSRATLIYDESEVFYDCGLHLQSSERGRNDSSRVGFTISFPADHLFRGVHDTITFDRSGGWSGRGGRQDEIIMRHVINQAGDSPDMYNDLVRVLTPQSTHTGTAMLLMAKYDDEFIDGSVYEKDGSLFKLELIYYPTTSVGNDPQKPKYPQPDEVIGFDIGNRGNSPESYRWILAAENHPGRDDYAGLVNLAQAFSLSGAALEQKTSELMDMEQWTRVFAFKTLSGDADTYGYGLTHNHLFYIPPSGKSLTFPWDMDFAWSRGATDSINVGSKIGTIIHTIPANQRLYLGNLNQILASSYNTNYLARWTAHYGTLAGQNYSGILSYIGQRAAFVRSQLRAPATFAITSPRDSIRTNVSTVTLRGSAPYTLKRLQLNDNPAQTFKWPAVESWETTVPLKFGTNLISIIAYDFWNQPAATNRITIVSTVGEPDTDGDGLPDAWEIQAGLNPNVPDALEDPDHDGLSNMAEFLAGTLPRDPDSKLALTVQERAGQLDLSFAAKAGRAYKLQYRLGITDQWRDLLTVPSITADRIVTQPQTISQVATALFYRVLLVSPAN